jgi:hypothetical protein
VYKARGNSESEINQQGFCLPQVCGRDNTHVNKPECRKSQVSRKQSRKEKIKRGSEMESKAWRPKPECLGKPCSCLDADEN